MNFRNEEKHARNETTLLDLFIISIQTSPKERRRSKMQLRRSQSMDYDDPSEAEEADQKRVFKLLSETDIQVGREVEF